MACAVTEIQKKVSCNQTPVRRQTEQVRELFRKRCAKCHGTDGTGSQARDRMAEIPDFTSAAWQAKRKDSQLIASILDGKGDDMPPGRGKISSEQARALAA
jgi:mono/diheme cytochrome c family protein